MPLAYLPSPPRSVWHLGPVPLRLQALCVIAGILLALWITDRRYRAGGGERGVIADVAAWAVPAGLIPAALGAILAPVHTGPWQAVRTWDAVIGFPGAAALGALAAWLACRRLRGQRGQRIRLGQVAGAAAPAMAFGHAMVAIGEWFTQQGYGRPSAVWWSVEISPAHRLQGYENFATFQPIFLYQALWDVAAGAGLIWAARRFAMPGIRLFALAAAAYAAGGFGLFWLGIGHLPVILGLRAGELGDAIVLMGAIVYLARTRRMRPTPLQNAQKPALESDTSVM
ncbi:MAG TPA: prolipoprotein diacylglyceryl transferase family protein [Trebonia sp.]